LGALVNVLVNVLGDNPAAEFIVKGAAWVLTPTLSPASRDTGVHAALR
jgi:hypothetical protein